MAERLTIAILGAGNIGGTLGRAWSVAGHRICFGVRDLQSQKIQSLRQELGDAVSIGSIAQALATKPEVVVIAVPGNTVDGIVTTHAAQLDGRIIIDTANRIGGSGSANSFSILQAQTPHAQVYRAFNTLGWENFADPLFDGTAADLFYCGPEGTSRRSIEQLIMDVGLRPIYLGGSEHVGLVDSLTTLWFTLAFGQRRGRRLAFKVLSR